MEINKANTPISVVIISLNEQKNMARLLKSVSWAQEVVVYDSGSTDQTIDIAKKMGARVISGEWLGFGKTKRKAVEYAQNDWILSLDCDEEVPPSLAAEVQGKVRSVNDHNVAYKIPRLSHYLGKQIRYGGWFPDYQTRLFNRKWSNWNSADIHEKVEAQKYEKLLSHMNHYVFKSIDHHVSTNNKYSGLQALEMFKTGKRFSWFHFLTKP